MNPITFTEAAIAHIKTMLQKSSLATGFRLSIKKTGCSGYAYVPSIVEEIKSEDIHFLVQDELHIYVDPACLSFINGLIIDYVADVGNGMKQKCLVYINPQEKNRCGCGESFTIE